MKRSLELLILTVLINAVLAFSQTSPSSTASQAVETPDVSYHMVLLLPQYRFIDTRGYAGRVGEYDSLQQSLAGDLSVHAVSFPLHTSIKSDFNFLSRDDYEIKSQLLTGKWLDLGLESRSFVRHLDTFSNFYAGAISNDIVRTDSILPDTLVGIRRRTNSAHAKVQLPGIPVKLFVKGGWQARDGNSQMQYYDMGGDTQCGTCHSASQYRTLNYTTRNIAGGAEVALARVKLVYQHEYRSFNDRLQNPSDYFGSTIGVPDDPLPSGPPQVPNTLAGLYTHSVLPRHTTQDDSLQVSLAVAHHLNFNGNVNYARSEDLFTAHRQNALNVDATLVWNPISPLRATADFHQQNLLNDFVPFYFLVGNPSLHRHYGGLKVQYRFTKQFEAESYYRRRNVTRSNADLWPSVYSPNNYDPLMVVPTTFSNIAGVALRFHTEHLWNVRTGYEWTGTHAPGYVTDPQTSHRVFGSVTVSPIQQVTFSNDGSIMLQQSFPAVQRSNHIYVDSTFLTVRPVPEWSLGAGYTYMQDNLRTDMRLMNDSGVGLYTQTLVPYKQLDQTFTVLSTYEIKKRLGFGVDFARSLAHSGFRPDLNPADYPIFPGAIDVAGYNSQQDYAAAFSAALALGSGPASLIDVPQSIVGSTLNYHFQKGFDGGLRFNYGSYADRMHPDLSGQLRSYTVFMGRVW